MSARICLKKIRYDMALSQSEFAKLLGINKATISLWELGMRKPSFPYVQKIVKKLKEMDIEIEYTDLRNVENDSKR